MIACGGAMETLGSYAPKSWIETCRTVHGQATLNEPILDSSSAYEMFL